MARTNSQRESRPRQGHARTDSPAQGRRVSQAPRTREGRRPQEERGRRQDLRGARVRPPRQDGREVRQKAGRGTRPVEKPAPPAAPGTRPAAKPAASSRIAGLDGLRTLAILAILVYHANAVWLPGGFIGVTVFFVISGFLITLSVGHELERTGTLRYPAFLWRRIRRLWPQMVAVVGVVALLTALMAPGLLGKVKTDAVPAVLFFENWYYILRDLSYFAAAGQPSPLTHFWYLGVIMQFYLLWPLLLFAMDRLGFSKRVRLLVTVVLAVASSVGMAVRFDPHGDTTRIYYGLDTRAAELLVGAACAFAFEGALTPARTRSYRQAPVNEPESVSLLSRMPIPPDLLAVCALVLLGWLCFSMTGYSAFLYRGGFLLTAVAAGLLVMAVAEPRCLVGRVLDLPPFTWLGKRSYSLYLWHYPLLILMNPATRTEALPWWGWAGELAIICCASELSFELFDGALARAGFSVGSRQKGRRAVPAHAVLDVVCAAGIIAVSLVPINLDAQTQGADATAGYVEAEGEDGAGATTDTTDTPEQVSRFDLDGTAFQNTTLATSIQDINGFGVRVDPETGATQANVLLIGDSVSGGGIIAGQDYFDEYFPNGRADYAIGRQVYVGPDIYAQYAANFDWGYVVWCLGNNGYASEDDVRALVECVGNRPVYLTTVRESNGLTDHNNEVFRTVAAEYDNCEIIDWYAASEGHSEYFYDDGTHLRAAGGQAYMLLIRQAICGE